MSTSHNNICTKARSIGLNVYFEKFTPGDGNCFYHSVIEGLKHNANAIGVPSYYKGSYASLRIDTVQYVMDHKSSEFVSTWVEQNLLIDVDILKVQPEYVDKDLGTIVKSENIRKIDKLEDILCRQRIPGTFALELFIRAAAIFLQTAIVFTKETSTIVYPYDVFWPWEVVPVDQSLQNYDGPYILIGHANNHFQSLYFNGLPPWKLISICQNNPSNFPGHFQLNSNVRRTNNIQLKSSDKCYNLDLIMSRLAPRNDGNSLYCRWETKTNM